MGSELPPVDAGGPLAAAEGIGPGSRVAGYVVLERVGRGGMAVVYRAQDDRLGRVVALKVLAPVLAEDEGFQRRFIRESRAAAMVDDPHIIPIHEAGEADGLLFMAMRFVAGGDVRSLLRRAGPLTGARVAALVSPVAAALDAAHGAGLVHRDVKPANMLLDARPGRPDHVYLSDFGLAKGALSSVGLTGTGLILGTPDYISPEQIAGARVDGRTDQYSLACAAYEMLTGEPLFVRDHPMAVIYAHASETPPCLTDRRPDLPADVDAALARALAKDPAGRYGDCREFAEALRAALGMPSYDPGLVSGDHARPVGAQPPSAPPRHYTMTVDVAGPAELEPPDTVGPTERPDADAALPAALSGVGTVTADHFAEAPGPVRGSADGPAELLHSAATDIRDSEEPAPARDRNAGKRLAFAAAAVSVVVLAAVAVLATRGGGPSREPAKRPGHGATASAISPWGTAQEVLGTGSGHAETDSVSCAAAGECAAGGYYTDGSKLQQAFIVSEHGGRWGTAIEMPGYSRLNAGEQYTGGVSLADLVKSVSCAAVGECSAAGGYTDGSGREQAFVVSEHDGRWGTAIEVPGIAALDAGAPKGGFGAETISVSCAAAGECAAGGSYSDGSGRLQAFVVSEHGGQWGTAIEVPGYGSLNTGARAAGIGFLANSVNSVSCAPAGQCAAGGFYTDGSGHQQAFVVSERGGRWGTAIEVPGTAALNSGGNAWTNSVSCAAAGQCAAGGYYTDGSGSAQAFVVSEQGGQWGTAIEVPGTAALNTGADHTNGGAQVLTMSCATVRSCGAGGSYTGLYTNNPGHWQAFVVSRP